MFTHLKPSIVFKLFVIVVLTGTYNITFAQPQFKYHDYIKKPEDTRIIERKVWRYNLEKDKPKVPDVHIDTIFKNDTIRNSDNSIHKVDSSIKTITKWISSSSFDFKFPDTVLYSKELFNERGLCIFKEGYFSGIDRPNYLYKHYKYDDKNREVVNTNSYQSIISPSIHITDFNDIKLTVYDNAVYGGGYLLYKYDTTGKLFQMEHYDTNDCIEGRTVYSYSKAGQFIKEMYTGLESDKRFTIYKLNNNGKILEDISYKKDSTFNVGRYYEYDYYGKLILDSLVYDLNDAPRKSFRNFYDSNHKLQMVKAKYGKEKYYLQKKYFYRKDGLLDYYLYLDDKGNATSKFQYQYKFR